MVEWLEEVEALTLKGKIAVPYTWWVGETGSLFLNKIRTEKKILGSQCPSCGVVFVPPRKNCGRCFVDIDSQVECGNGGVVTAYTIVRKEHPLYPVKTPFALALIRLDGADVAITHLITRNLEKLKNGTRVEAQFKKESERVGHILDIECFRII
jgi:uncharacterized OB-fold protein